MFSIVFKIKSGGSMALFFCLLLSIIITSCGGGWPDDEKKIFLEQCRNGALSQKVDNADKHCSCMLDKLEKAYPNPEEVQRISPTNLMQMAAACQDSVSAKTTGLKAQDRTNFMDKCRQMANADARIKDPGSFCECLLDQLMQRPVGLSPASLSPDTLAKMGLKCQ